MESSVENVRCNSPDSQSEARASRTIAVTLRMPKWWVTKLKKMAREESLKDNMDLNYCDLIRESIYSAYIDPIDGVFGVNNCNACSKRMDHDQMLQLLGCCKST